MPAKKQAQFRLSDQVLDALQQLADRLDKPRAEVLEIAVAHLDGTLRNSQPVYIGPPPSSPAAHKKAQRAG